MLHCQAQCLSGSGTVSTQGMRADCSCAVQQLPAGSTECARSCVCNSGVLLRCVCVVLCFRQAHLLVQGTGLLALCAWSADARMLTLQLVIAGSPASVLVAWLVCGKTSNRFHLGVHRGVKTATGCWIL
jgi:hypothetical protein